ncbi:MAG: bifunctional aspartate kinase/homoserine dehydrogenase I, partial [Cyclobacteriaceae bacterium]|nr:bifunctional aspartate kinase/homoserine dehydrogenase I [Cyclobacteriaceae bacterium]
TNKTNDYLLSFGEVLSSLIFSDYLNSINKKNHLADPRLFIKTDSRYGNARVDFTSTTIKTKEYFKEISGITICPGFISSNQEGEVTTLGRGGSDYSAAILANILNVTRLEIWTDVNGLMTADPRFVSSAKTIKSISYEDAMELSHFGAKVIYPPTIQPALSKKIPILIKNTFDKDGDGTLITHDGQNGQENIIKGLSCIQNIALLNMKGSGMVGIPNFSYRLFKALAARKVNVIMITQASSEHSICIGINESDSEISSKAIEEEFVYEHSVNKIDPLEIEKKLSIIALVGSKMKHQVGVSGKMFNTLGNNGINIKAIAQGSSERNISVVIDQYNLKKALSSLHESFFLSESKRVNLFIIGVGNVGATFIEQIQKQQQFLKESQHLDIQVVGLANSQKMYFEEDGIELDKWKDKLYSSNLKFDTEEYLKNIKKLNLRNSVFIDNTANEKISKMYIKCLQNNISVVTPNKIACSSKYEDYLNLKTTALHQGSKFLFETNVGAGLPILSTLGELVKSGDQINKIEAVLSGSLNFIFNNYNGESSFSSIVAEAKRLGYTEPDPRIDLSGIDVKRKILILIREGGYQMEIDDVKTIPFIPEEIMEDDKYSKFFELLEENEDVFKNLLKKAGDHKIKYVATFEDGKASTGLQFIPSNHPFYNLEGKDNIVLLHTKRYSDQPLVIKGAGAGAEVTASGIFADVLRFANR